MASIKKTAVGILLVLSVTTVAFAENPWELKKNKDGIKVSVREVEGSKILEYKGIVVLDAVPDAAVLLFEDDARTTEWFHQCAESRLIKQNAPHDEVFYSVISMPWPVSDRDLVYRRLHSKDPATGTVEYTTSALPEAYPEQDGKVRMPYLKEVWRFTPLEGSRTEMYYQSHSETGGSIPSWLVNKLAVNIPYESLDQFREILAREPDSFALESSTPVQLRQGPDDPVRFEKKERESNIKAIAEVESVEVAESDPERGTVRKKVAFRLLRPLVDKVVPARFIGYCDSVMEGREAPAGGTIYCYPVQGVKVYVAISDDGGNVTGYSAIGEEEEKRIIDEYEKGEPSEYVLRW